MAGTADNEKFLQEQHARDNPIGESTFQARATPLPASGQVLTRKQALLTGTTPTPALAPKLRAKGAASGGPPNKASTFSFPTISGAGKAAAGQGGEVDQAEDNQSQQLGHKGRQGQEEADPEVRDPREASSSRPAAPLRLTTLEEEVRWNNNPTFPPDARYTRRPATPLENMALAASFGFGDQQGEKYGQGDLGQDNREEDIYEISGAGNQEGEVGGMILVSPQRVAQVTQMQITPALQQVIAHQIAQAFASIEQQRRRQEQCQQMEYQRQQEQEQARGYQAAQELQHPQQPHPQQPEAQEEELEEPGKKRPRSTAAPYVQPAGAQPYQPTPTSQGRQPLAATQVPVREATPSWATAREQGTPREGREEQAPEQPQVPYGEGGRINSSSGGVRRHATPRRMQVPQTAGGRYQEAAPQPNHRPPSRMEDAAQGYPQQRPQYYQHATREEEPEIWQQDWREEEDAPNYPNLPRWNRRGDRDTEREQEEEPPRELPSLVLVAPVSSVQAQPLAQQVQYIQPRTVAAAALKKVPVWEARKGLETFVIFHKEVCDYQLRNNNIWEEQEAAIFGIMIGQAAAKQFVQGHRQEILNLCPSSKAAQEMLGNKREALEGLHSLPNRLDQEDEALTEAMQEAERGEGGNSKTVQQKVTIHSRTGAKEVGLVHAFLTVAAVYYAEPRPEEYKIWK